MPNKPEEYGEMLKKQISVLTKLASETTDSCIVAKFIAFKEKEVNELFVQKLVAGNVFRGVSCIPCHLQPQSVIVVLIDFDCPPDQICLVRPWFAVGVDMNFRRIIGIQDPYIPPTSIDVLGSNCGEIKDELSRRFSRVKFGGCDFPDPASADAYACGTLFPQLVAENPGCITNTECGHRTVKNKTPVGSYHTYLPYAGCDYPKTSSGCESV